MANKKRRRCEEHLLRSNPVSKIPIILLIAWLVPSRAMAQSPMHMALATCMSTGRTALECCIELTCDEMARSCASHWDATARMQCLANNCPNPAATQACLELGAGMDFGQPPGEPDPPAPPVVNPPAPNPLMAKLEAALKTYCIPKDESACMTKAEYDMSCPASNKCRCAANSRWDSSARRCYADCEFGADGCATACVPPNILESGLFVGRASATVASCPSGSISSRLVGNAGIISSCPVGSVKISY